MQGNPREDIGSGLRIRAADLGPGLLVTAAFIGPGTITTASTAGARFGYSLVWALAFSLLATLALQEMAARQALVTRSSLAANLRRTLRSAATGRALLLLVILAIGAGNAAYEAGNISGASLALSSVSGWGNDIWAVVVGSASAALLWRGRYRVLERVLIALVLLMSGVFLVCAFAVLPSLATLGDGVSNPLPEGSMLTAIALIGTTVVPYNLFLHASAATNKWSDEMPLQQALLASRWDTALSIGLGGLITLAIMSTAAVSFFGSGVEFDGLAMAHQLRPVFGDAAEPLFAIGLFASGLTSALTAPLAAGFAVAGALGRTAVPEDAVCRGVALLVLLCGTVFAALGTKPLTAILMAQAANAFLLPLVAVTLVVMMNRRDLLGDYINGTLANILGAFVVLVSTLLGASRLVQLLWT